MALLLSIDAGHGGGQPGSDEYGSVAPDGRREKDWTLATALALAERLVANPAWKASQIRSIDAVVPLSERGKISAAQGADLVLSLHLNSGPPQMHGAMAFYWPGNQDGAAVAEACMGAWPLSLRQHAGSVWATIDGARAEDRWLSRARNVLAPHRATAVLIECGFLSHDSDRSDLWSPATLDGILSAIECGLAAFRTRREPKSSAVYVGGNSP